jgi:hypothetical protein
MEADFARVSDALNLLTKENAVLQQQLEMHSQLQQQLLIPRRSSVSAPRRSLPLLPVPPVFQTLASEDQEYIKDLQAELESSQWTKNVYNRTTISLR